jgi:hypothetical protein
MAAARGAGGARVSNAYLRLLGWRDKVFRHIHLISIITQLYKIWVKMFQLSNETIDFH